jgi:hypothetical protein
MRVSTISRPTTYVHTHGSTSEFRMLKLCFLIANIICRNAFCDSCRGSIGGPRLFCLDCVIKDTEDYDSVDLCCAPECIGARITHRKDLESPHEPNHRLVKARTPVLTRSHGRTYTKACEAFQRVRGFCTKIAEFSSHPLEGTGFREQKTSSPEPTSTEMPAEGNKLDDVHTTPDPGCTKDGAEAEDKTATDAVQGPVPHQDLPTCGKCKSGLSFPFWYCIICEGRSREPHHSPLLADHPFCATR